MQESELWQAVLGEIELSGLSRGSFVTWFKNTQMIRFKDGVVVVGVPNVFIKNQLEKKFHELIVNTLANNGVRPQRVEYKIHTGISPKASKEEVEEVFKNLGAVEAVKTASVKQAAIANVTHSYRQGLNERYSFENFVVGAGNELAYAACQAIAAKPGTKYNPLFIYGGVGIGKTHLIQAVGNAITAARPKFKVIYASTEQFVQEFVDALRFKKNTSDFAGFYRGSDVLIVDDVQFLAGKEKIQEEFFHTFNALYQANKQIIMSADKPPKDIPTLEERLRSRFAQGMTIDMQAPDFETRCAILQSKAASQDARLDQAVVELLASRIHSNIRELEGALNQLLAYCEMRGIEPDLQVAASIFEGSKGRPKHISPRQIIERTAKHFHISMEEILGPKRDKDIVVPRQIAMYMLRSELHLSFPKIAHELGRKDHTTAIHSIGKIEKEINYDGPIKQFVNEIKERLYA
ncbi:MAG: Chromosomal replication initiator protein DnaA [Candidatus Saccharibacteria bacterium GW2011_GWA2_46_10]|nr:MAG: Chromosomal replication initiator protein DnaA [Candidatus Saccharibacteria bacterium GW2011_GWA2_46_10]OGL36384.1 MAG: chromosomal replication initiator DnaA [Candidatus Saccharibacteria bacterium RIFCSPHIGHO2_12_FULL_47_17]